MNSSTTAPLRPPDPDNDPLIGASEAQLAQKSAQKVLLRLQNRQRSLSDPHEHQVTAFNMAHSSHYPKKKLPRKLKPLRDVRPDDMSPGPSSTSSDCMFDYCEFDEALNVNDEPEADDPREGAISRVSQRPRPPTPSP